MRISLCVRRSHLLGSQLIRWGTKETFSHIGVSLDNANTVYHSDSKGCRVESAWDFAVNSHAEVAYSFKVTTEEYISMLWRAKSKLGAKYDFLGVLGFGVFLLLSRFGLSFRPIFNPKWLFCSEYAEYIIFGTNTTLTPMQVVEKAKKTWQK